MTELGEFRIRNGHLQYCITIIGSAGQIECRRNVIMTIMSRPKTRARTDITFGPNVLGVTSPAPGY